MAKKYEIPEEKKQIVSEPVAAYALKYDYERKMRVVAHEDNAEWDEYIVDNPKLLISEEELRRMGRECINTSSVSADDAISHFMNM